MPPIYDPWALWKVSSASLAGGTKRRKRKGSRFSARPSTATKTARRSKPSSTRLISRKSRPARLVKGSAAARAYMAKIRKLRK